MNTKKPPLRGACKAALLCSLLSLHLLPLHAVTPSGSRLRTLADQNDLWFGSAINEYGFWTPDSAAYLDLLGAEAGIFTPEGSMKFAGVQPAQNVFDYEDGDRVVNYAIGKNAAVHGHTLLWYYGNPSWLENGTWTAATLTGVMNNHIDNVVTHWKGKIAVWDVVNEAIDGTKSNADWTQNLRYSNDIWNRTIGAGYIEKAFIRARAADPDAILIYNDYDQELLNAKSNTMYAMMTDFTSRGIPVDGVGFQCHWMSATPDYASLAANLDRFAKLGLLIYITEFDTSNTSGALGTVPSAANDAQARIYHNATEVFLRNPAVASIQTWGLTDKYTWMTWLGLDAYPLPFDSNYVAKPAYYALQDAFARQRRDELTVNGGIGSGVLSPWTPRNGATLAAGTASPHSGSHVLSTTARTADGQGPSQDVTGQLIAQGAGRYTLAAWARFAGGVGTVRAVLTLNDGNGSHRYTVSKVAGTSWTELKGDLNVTWFKTLASATLHFDTPGYTTAFDVDDVRLGDGNILVNGAFENGTAGWSAQGGSFTLSASTASAAHHYGARGLSVSGRTAAWQVPGQDIRAALLAQGPGAYTFQAYLKQVSGTGNARVNLRLTYGGVDHYVTGASGAINATSWTKLASAAPVNVTWSGTLTGAILYVETPGSTADFYVDDAWMRK